MDIRNVIQNRNVRGKIMYGLSFLPDEVYVSLFYFAVTGRIPNLKNPVGYNEKLQWLKLHNRHEEYRDLADKLSVRQHIAKKIGEEYLIPLLGSWSSFEQINFDELPNEFVLKCNHDSGSVKLIQDKERLSQEEKDALRKYYSRKLKRDFFYAGREYPYKGISPRIMAEKMMHAELDDEGGIKDYKFYCFNGEPKLLLVVSGRQTEKHKDFFDMEFNRIHIERGCTESEICPSKPKCFEEMKDMARILSQGICQVRMDFYEVDGRPYFGEYTFFAGGGFELFHPEEWELRLGSWIDLDSSKVVREWE